MLLDEVSVLSPSQWKDQWKTNPSLIFTTVTEICWMESSFATGLSLGSLPQHPEALVRMINDLKHAEPTSFIHPLSKLTD